jgi:hypothetical protein
MARDVKEFILTTRRAKVIRTTIPTGAKHECGHVAHYPSLTVGDTVFRRVAIHASHNDEERKWWAQSNDCY